MCHICLRNSAGPQLLTPTYWGEVKKCDNCRSWQQSLRALWDKMSPDSFSTRWFPTKGCSSPFPLSAWIQISQDAQRKWTQHWLPKAHTLLWISSTAMATLVLVTLNGDTGAPWHPDPQGDIRVSTSPYNQLTKSELSLPAKKEGCQTQIWDWPLKDKFLSHQGIFWLSDTDLGPRPIPASPVYFLWLGSNLHHHDTEF